MLINELIKRAYGLELYTNSLQLLHHWTKRHWLQVFERLSRTPELPRNRTERTRTLYTGPGITVGPIIPGPVIPGPVLPGPEVPGPVNTGAGCTGKTGPGIVRVP